MPFVPHSPAEVEEMLQVIGAESIEQLFDEIPQGLRAQPMTTIPEGINEHQMTRIMKAHAAQDREQLNFIGAGVYQHHIPAAVWDLVGRGEFMTAYTPYQAEASQGGLQVIYEYQTMMARLMQMDVSNASLYEGASALAESMLMAIRANRRAKSRRIVVLGEISPQYRQVIETILPHQNIEIEYCHFGMTNSSEYLQQLNAYAGDIAAVVIAQPNFLGRIVSADALTDWAHAQGALVVALVNPTAMALLKPPGQWGETGADIVCGEGQPLGVPLASGGPYFGFMCCKQVYVRQMPGRIVGRSHDETGKVGYCLTLQAREQHIRRAKATSNICTNQGLLVTSATIYMGLLGGVGLKQVAAQCHAHTRQLAQTLTAIPGVELLSQDEFFHECVVRLPQPVSQVLDQLAEQHIQGGYDLSQHFPELGNALLICSTEVHESEDHQRYAAALSSVLADATDGAKQQEAATC